MEEKTLKQLNEEYRSLVTEVERMKSELKTAIAVKDTADENYERASAEFTARKETFEALNSGLEKIGETGFSGEIIARMEEEVAAARRLMEEAELALTTKEAEQSAARENFSRVEGVAKEKSSRLDVILISFAANETINKAISNEIEIDYTEMTEKKQAEKAEIEALKTKINDDAKMQEEVGNLGELLTRFEELKKKVTPENTAELAEVGNQIKTKRNLIRRRIRTLGVKGGKISVEEIDKMTTERDGQGRIVVGELNRRTGVVDAEIANIEVEKKEMLAKMAMALEMGRQNSQDSAEYLRLTGEIEELKTEKIKLESQQGESRKALEDITGQRKQLNSELETLGASQVDQGKIERLQQERAAIEAEKIEKIENPEKVSLRQQISELKAKKNSGVKTNVETDEYKAAKSKVDAARIDLDDEKQFPSIGVLAAKTDEVVNNPEFTRLQAELELKERNFKAFGDIIITSNPDLKELNSAYVELKGEEEELLDQYQMAESNLSDNEREFIRNYVSDEIYPDLADENSELAKSFEAYKQAELQVRKAMLAIQKDPSSENLEALYDARLTLNETTGNLQELLSNYQHNTETPTPVAIHNYLLGKLKEAYDNFEPIDEAYDLNNAERRIAIVESKTGKDEELAVVSLSQSSRELEQMLDDILDGKAIDEEMLLNIVNTHKHSIELFEEPDKIRSLLKGTDLDVQNTRFGFIKRFISRFTMPKVEERYYFPENRKPAGMAEYGDAITQRNELRERILGVRQQKEDARVAFNSKMEEVATPEQKESWKNKREEIANLKRKIATTPRQINKTKLAALEETLRNAEAELNGVPQYKTSVDTKDIESKLTELVARFNKEPDKIDDPEKVADKKRRLAKNDAEIQDAMKDKENPRRGEILASLASLDTREAEERTRADEIAARLATLTGTLKERGGLLAALEVARQKIVNLIHIKDANKMLDRRSGRIAEDLVNAVKPKVKTDEEEKDEEEIEK